MSDRQLCRWIQYFTKFLAAALVRSMLMGKNTKFFAERVASLSANLSLTRKVSSKLSKVLRFGKPISVAKDLIEKVSKGEVQGFGMFRFLGSIALGLYFLSDHLVYFHKIGKSESAQGLRSSLMRLLKS